MNHRHISISLFAGTIVGSLWAWVPAAWSGSPSPVEDQASYLPIQSISYEFGSKSMSGYFVDQAATCRVTLMIIERIEPEKSLPSSPTRVRLVLSPGQIAGLDSEEGQSLNFTCGEDAKTLLVDAGERAKLVALQRIAKSEGRDYFGVGGDSCGAWINARAKSDAARHGSWVLGYISALNVWGKDALKNLDAAGIYHWLDTYCQENPLGTVATAAGKLVREIRSSLPLAPM